MNLSNINDWIKLLGTLIFATIAIIGAVSYIFSRVSRNDLDTLRQNNKDLEDRVKIVEDDKKDLITRVNDLELQVKNLQSKNGSLGDIITLALQHYWEEHPKEALKVAKILASK